MTGSLPPEEQPLDVLVIGAGQAGLALAWHLKRAGVRFLAVDAGSRIGGAWRSRWDSLRLFTPSRYDSLPGLPFPAPPGSYPTKDQVADYLETYAETFQLPVRLGTRVIRLRRSAESFTADTTTGSLAARQVVVATGAFISPYVPSHLAEGLAPHVVQLHSAQYRRAADLPHGHVLVVGAGNSGVQIAADLAASGRPVSIAVGTRPYMVPQRVLGLDLFWWLTRLGFAPRPGAGATRRSRPQDFDFGAALLRLRAGRDVFRSRATTVPVNSAGLVIGTSWRRLRASGITLRPRAMTAAETTVGFADGTALDVAGVVWATGFRADYPWLEVPGVIVDGKLQHTQGISAVPGLAFLGLVRQRSRGSTWLGFVADDAAWLAERLISGSPLSATPLGGTGPVRPGEAIMAGTQLVAEPLLGRGMRLGAPPVTLGNATPRSVERHPACSRHRPEPEVPDRRGRRLEPGPRRPTREPTLTPPPVGQVLRSRLTGTTATPRSFLAGTLRSVFSGVDRPLHQMEGPSDGASAAQEQWSLPASADTG